MTRAVPGDAYWVDNLQLDSASLLSSAEIASPVSLEVSLNGQDYSALGFRYSYLSQPQISALLPPGGPLGGDTRVRVHARSTFAMIDQEEMADYTCAFGPETSGDPRSGGPQNDPRSGTALLVSGRHLFDGAMRCVTVPLNKARAATMGFEVRTLALA